MSETRTYTNDNGVYWDNCIDCGEPKTTIGCKCDRDRLDKELAVMFNAAIDKVCNSQWNTTVTFK